MDYVAHSNTEWRRPTAKRPSQKCNKEITMDGLKSFLKVENMLFSPHRD